MSSIIEQAKATAEQRKNAEDRMRKKAAERSNDLHRRLGILKDSILPEVRKLEGETTKHGKFACQDGMGGGEILRIYCNSKNPYVNQNLALILMADIHTYEWSPCDEIREERTEPRVYARVFRPFPSEKPVHVETYTSVEQFLKDLGSALSSWFE